MIATDKIRENEETLRKQKQLLTDYKVIYHKGKTMIPHVYCSNLGKLIYDQCGLHLKTLEDIDTGKQIIYYYKDGMYYPGAKNKIKRLVDIYLDTLTNINIKNEVVDYVRNCNVVSREGLEPPLHLINMNNGIFNLKTNTLESHNPKYFFLNQIPVDYKKDMDCPNIKKFFNKVVYPDYVPVIQEMFGFVLYRKYLQHVAFLLYGGGRNGKGTTINLLEHFVGSKNYSSRNLHDLIENRFSKGDLYGKLCNLGAEISSRALVDTGDFKNLTGGEPITGEKKFGSGFNFLNYAKLIFNSNHMPFCKFDKSTAYFERWLVVVFPRTFKRGDSGTNPNILDEISTPDELSGLFNWSLKGLRRVLKDFKFSEVVHEGGAEEWYEMLKNPDKRFIREHLESVQDVHLQKGEVYERYVDWARSGSYPVQTSNAFTRTLRKELNPKDATKERGFRSGENVSIRNGGGVVKGYRNVNWRLEVVDVMQPKNTRVDSFISKDEKVKHVEEKYK